MPPTGLKGAQLARVRADATKLLTDTCTIKGMLGNPRTLQVIATNVPCRVSEATHESAPVNAEYLSGTPIFELTVSYNQALELDQQVTHGVSVYQVFAVEPDGTSLVQKRAWLRLVKAS